MKPLSLKVRILLGAVLWTLGLFMLARLVVHSGFDRLLRVAAANHLSGDVTFQRIAIHHAPAISIVGLFLMVTGFLHVRRGLSPINQLRGRLAAVHKGTASRVDGSYPPEVQPLVDDLNALLEERERRVARAVARAGDLAHGLKTPLAVLAHEADQTRVEGHGQLAEEIHQQVDRMRRQIDYHLAHARSAASSSSPNACASIAACLEGLVRALRRLHAERNLHIEIDAPISHTFQGQREDLDEMLGNLIDNACKWARTQVRLASLKTGKQIVVVIDDDGPGIEHSMREAVMQRGVRADESGKGSGLGLAIVRDLADIYGGSVSLEDSPMGGSRARLTLPANEVI